MSGVVAAERMRVRVTAGSPTRRATGDSFQNFLANLGVGTNNLTTGSTYGYNPITRNHILLEWMYRGSWLVGAMIDAIADDMTRMGVEIDSSVIGPEQLAQMEQALTGFRIWQRINQAIKWGRSVRWGDCRAVY